MEKLSVSMQEVADAAGVHRATVSRALRNDPRITPEVRARVQAAAEKLGYRPNALISALMSHRRAVTAPAFQAIMAYVTRFSAHGAWREVSESFVRIYDGAAQCARRQGYTLEEFCVNDPKLSSAAFSRMLYARGIHALLLAPLPRPSGHMRLDWARFAPVTVGYSLLRPELHRVATDHFGSLVQAMRQCRRRGYRRLGVLLTGWVNERTDRRWLGALLAENEHADAAHRIPALITKDFNDAAFRRWFREHRPEVILGVHLYRVLEVLKKMRVRVPEDVGLVTLELRERERGFTGMDQSFERIGEASVNTLIGMLHRGERGIPEVPQKILIDARWVEGGTLR